MITYAWFIITNTNHSMLVSRVSEVEAEYEFYRFQDSWHNGNSNPLLLDQLCSIEKDDQCYASIPDPAQVFNLEQAISPGERFSFAIMITTLGNEAYLNLDLGRVSSSYSLENEMRIQDAFLYQVSKVSYVIDGIEGEDQKENTPIVYSQAYFMGDNDTIYPLIHHVPMNLEVGEDVKVIIYFDFYYDPDVKGLDDLGNPNLNQNHLAHQKLIIEDIYMMISPTLQ